MRLQGVSLFKPGADATYEQGRHDSMLAELTKDFGKNLTVHTLKYHAPTAVEAIWNATQKQGKSFLDSFERTTHKPQDEADKQAWQKAKTAALSADRNQYSSAMRILAQNAKTGRSLE